ncbi:hypothetical protein KAJ27_17300 [bacterium]|nr:hypothetical protein [bacterium]
MSIDPKKPWDSNNGISVVKDQEVTISASGKWDADGGVRVGANHVGAIDADGYNPGLTYSGGIIKFNLLAKINGQIISVGKYKKFKAPSTGMILFGHDDPLAGCFDNEGILNLQITLNDGGKKVPIPGIPDNPKHTGTKIKGITGLQIVNEDQEYTWYGDGNSEVILAPNSMINYTFTFGDQYDTTPFNGSFDPFKVNDILKHIRGPHIFKESGLSYDIYLTVNFTKREYQAHNKFTDIPCKHYAGPFKIVVVDHLPEYIGNLFFFIIGPRNATDRPMLSSVKNTDMIFEDPDQDIVKFYISAIINLYTELSPGMNTGIDPDRFSGIDPTSVKYKINFGDGSPETSWIQFEEVNKAKPKSLLESMKKSLYESRPWSHDYSEPGEYKMKVTISFQEIKYKSILQNGTTYTYEKYKTPYQVQSMEKKIIVADRTPPRISASNIVDLIGFTGDLLNVEFIVEDNNMHMELKDAVFLMEKYDSIGQYTSHPLAIEDYGLSQIKGKMYKVTGRIVMPEKFAHKPEISSTALEYLIKVIDGEGNCNTSVVSVIEDSPPYYGIKDSDGRPKPDYPGKLIIQDNDPPSITIKFTYNEKTLVNVQLTEDYADYININNPTRADVKICDKIIGNCWTEIDPESNPRKSFKGLTSIEFKKVLGKIPEDSRIQLEITTIDNVDSEASLINLECNQKKNSFSKGHGKCNFIFSKSGKQEFKVNIWDKPNLDKSFCGREVKFYIDILDSKILFHTLNKSK